MKGPVGVSSLKLITATMATWVQGNDMVDWFLSYDGLAKRKCGNILFSYHHYTSIFAMKISHTVNAKHINMN